MNNVLANNTISVQRIRYPLDTFYYSITFKEDFKESKRFKKFKDDIKDKIKIFLLDNYSVITYDENSAKPSNDMEYYTYPNYFKYSLMNYFELKMSIIKDNYKCSKSDYIIIPHIYKYSLLWEKELKYLNALSMTNKSDLYNEVILNYLDDYLSDEYEDPNLPSIDDIINSEFTELCLDIIREKEQFQNINESNWLNLCKIENQNEVFNFIRRFMTILIYDVENVLNSIIDYERNKTNYEHLLDQNVLLKASEEEAYDTLKEKEVEFNKQILAVQNKLKEEQNKNIELTNKLSNIKNEYSDKYKSEIYTVNKQLKDSENEYNKLNKKYKESLERIKMLEDIVNEFESTKIEKTVKYNEEFFNRKFIFVRDNFAKDYVILDELSKLFSNSIFSTGIPTDIKNQNIDGVVFLTRFEHHSNYYKAKNTCNNMNIPYVHCDASNIDIIVSTIYNQFLKNNNRKE